MEWRTTRQSEKLPQRYRKWVLFQDRTEQNWKHLQRQTRKSARHGHKQWKPFRSMTDWWKSRAITLETWCWVLSHLLQITYLRNLVKVWEMVFLPDFVNSVNGDQRTKNWLHKWDQESKSFQHKFLEKPLMQCQIWQKRRIKSFRVISLKMPQSVERLTLHGKRWSATHFRNGGNQAESQRLLKRYLV